MSEEETTLRMRMASLEEFKARRPDIPPKVFRLPDGMDQKTRIDASRERRH
jgi:hypothetical protein